MQTKNLQKMAITALEDLQALDLRLMDVRSLTTITDFMILCTGRSTRHVKAIADNLIMVAKKKQLSYLHLEGELDDGWMLVDMGDLVVHIMLPTVRAFYNLEALWEPMTMSAELKTKSAK